MTSEKVTTAELRKRNRNKVYQMIYTRKKTSKQEIAGTLNLSLPTVSQNLKELEALQLIERNGLYESSGGRKPQAICCIRQSRAAIGIAVSKETIHLACIDIYGAIIKEIWMDLPYEATLSYCQNVGEILRDFIADLKIPEKKILGVGITLQGTVSLDGQSIAYGTILDNAGFRLQDFAQFIPYPCHFVHDAEAAAISELHFNPQMPDTVYLAIGDNIGSAIIMNSTIYRGSHSGGGFIEHMTVIPDGRPCYCGKKGCFETYCSLQALCGGQKHMADFFASLHRQEADCMQQWHTYLETLAEVIDHIHTIIDCNVLIGGPLTSYMTQEDLEDLNRMVLERCVFPEKRPYVQVSQCRDSVDVVGSAITYIDQFIEEV